MLVLLLALCADPMMPIPSDNPLTPAKAALGRKLFFDGRLSADGTVSCATCHQPARGWADGLPVSKGSQGRQGTRNAPTIANAAWERLMFRDGRAALLEGQALLPLTSASEMGNRSLGQVVSRLNATGYREEFREAFGTEVTADGIAKAIASFERTVVARDAPVDEFLAGRTWALTRAQKHGMRVFERSGCRSCHAGPDFRDGQFHNTGTSVGERDQGRFTITGNRTDFDAFKTPTLREVGRTAPYFHSGRAATLRDVVEHYDAGGVATTGLDPRVRPLGLPENDKQALVEFLTGAFLSGSLVIEKPELPQ